MIFIFKVHCFIMTLLYLVSPSQSKPTDQRQQLRRPLIANNDNHLANQMNNHQKNDLDNSANQHSPHLYLVQKLANHQSSYVDPQLKPTNQRSSNLIVYEHQSDQHRSVLSLIRLNNNNDDTLRRKRNIVPSSGIRGPNVQLEYTIYAPHEHDVIDSMPSLASYSDNSAGANNRVSRSIQDDSKRDSQNSSDSNDQEDFVISVDSQFSQLNDKNSHRDDTDDNQASGSFDLPSNTAELPPQNYKSNARHDTVASVGNRDQTTKRLTGSGGNVPANSRSRKISKKSRRRKSKSRKKSTEFSSTKRIFNNNPDDDTSNSPDPDLDYAVQSVITTEAIFKKRAYLANERRGEENIIHDRLQSSVVDDEAVLTSSWKSLESPVFHTPAPHRRRHQRRRNNRRRWDTSLRQNSERRHQSSIDDDQSGFNPESSLAGGDGKNLDSIGSRHDVRNERLRAFAASESDVTELQTSPPELPVAAPAFKRDMANYRSLCATETRTVMLNTAEYDYEPPFYSETLCDHKYRNGTIITSHKQRCAVDFLDCVQQHQVFRFTRRQTRSEDRWEPYSLEVPSSCECMWPLDQNGPLKLHHDHEDL